MSNAFFCLQTIAIVRPSRDHGLTLHPTAHLSVLHPKWASLLRKGSILNSYALLHTILTWLSKLATFRLWTRFENMFSSRYSWPKWIIISSTRTLLMITRLAVTAVGNNGDVLEKRGREGLWMEYKLGSEGWVLLTSVMSLAVLFGSGPVLGY